MVKKKNYGVLTKKEIKSLFRLRRILFIVSSGLISFYIGSLIIPDTNIYLRVAIGSFISAIVSETID